MGDILLATPLVRCLRKRFPQADIDFAVRERFSGLLQNNPNLNDQLILEEPGEFCNLNKLKRIVRQRKYDLLIDIHSNFRSFYLCSGVKADIYRWRIPRLRRWALVKFKKNYLKESPPVPLRYLAAAEKLGVEDDGEGLGFYPSQDSDNKCSQLLAENNLNEDSVIIAIALGAKWFTKRWQPEKFAETASILLREYCDAVMLLGSVQERQLCADIAVQIEGKVLNLAGETDFDFAGSIIKGASLFIGNDSGLNHLAAAVKTPAVTIFGSTVKEFGFFPFRNKSIVIEKELYCRPCSHIGKNHCPQNHFRCMGDIAVEEIAQTVDKLLAEK